MLTTASSVVAGGVALMPGSNLKGRPEIARAMSVADRLTTSDGKVEGSDRKAESPPLQKRAAALKDGMPSA